MDWEERIPLLLTVNKCDYLENPKDATKLPELKSDFSKATGYKVNT